MLSKGRGSMIQHKHLLINAFIDRPIFQEAEAERFLIDVVDQIRMKRIIEPCLLYTSDAADE